MITPRDTHLGTSGTSVTGLSEAGDPRLAVRGELDASNAAAFAAELWRTAADRPFVVVDLRGLSFIDCAGARVLEQFHRARRAGGATTTVVVATGGLVERFLKLAGLAAVLDVHAAPAPVEVALGRCA